MATAMHHIKPYTFDDLCRLVDHTNLHANATENDMKRLCDEAKMFHFRMVAVNEAQVEYCARELAGTDIDTGAAIAFPLGQTTIACKVAETRDAIAHGAQEIDYVVNLTQVKRHNWAYVKDEMKQIVDVCNNAEVQRGAHWVRGISSKVIFECCYLNDEEKIRLCELAHKVGPTFIKTSTGFGSHGATIHDVRLMRHYVGAEVQVKAAGGIRSADDFQEMVRAGATRIGTSASVAIMEEIRTCMQEANVGCIEL